MDKKRIDLLLVKQVADKGHWLIIIYSKSIFYFLVLSKCTALAEKKKQF